MRKSAIHKRRFWLVFPALLLAALAVNVTLPAAQADAATTYYHFVNASTRKALSFQQGQVLVVAPDRTRFAQQWQVIDVRPDGTFMLRNRGGLDACLARRTAPPQDLEIVEVAGCAGTNETRKRWRTAIAGGIEGELHEYVINVASQQILAPGLCIVFCPPDDSGALYSQQFMTQLIVPGGLPATYFSWVIRSI